MAITLLGVDGRSLFDFEVEAIVIWVVRGAIAVCFLWRADRDVEVLMRRSVLDFCGDRDVEVLRGRSLFIFVERRS
ncbi:MAG: hypothetical protein WCP16_04295 [Pseudanabaena sp. ELA645]